MSLAPPGRSERDRSIARRVAAGLHVILALADVQRAPLCVGEAQRGRRGVDWCGGLAHSLLLRLEEACSQ